MAIKNENPVFAEAKKALDKQQDEGASPVTYPEVLIRFAGFLVLVVAGAAVGWTVLFAALAGLGTFAFIALLLALFGVGVAATRAFSRGKIGLGVALSAVYAIGEGVIIGYISRLYNEAFGGGIVGQAILATAITVLVVVGFSATPLGRRTGRAVKVFTVAVIAYVLFSLISLGLGVFLGVGDGWGVFGLGLFGIIACLIGVLFASWSVNIDVVTINDMVESETPAPRGMPWLLAFGLTVSILWLYLEILRLLGMARR